MQFATVAGVVGYGMTDPLLEGCQLVGGGILSCV